VGLNVCISKEPAFGHFNSKDMHFWHGYLPPRVDAVLRVAQRQIVSLLTTRTLLRLMTSIVDIGRL